MKPLSDCLVMIRYSGDWKIDLHGASIFEYLPYELSNPYCGESVGVESLSVGWNIPRVRNDGAVVGVLDAGFDGADLLEYYDVFDGTFPCHDHGTHVVGIVQMVSPGPVIGIRVTDGDVFDMSVLAAGVDLAVELGVDVILMCWGGSLGGDTALYHSLVSAHEAGVLLVAASGNRGVIEYPARWPFVLAVGSVRDSNIRSSYSGLGDTWGYGDDVVSNVCSGCRVKKSGTSMAAPQVAALLVSGLDVDDLVFSLFGIPFMVAGDWNVIIDNGYDYEVVAVIDGVVRSVSVPRSGVMVWRDDSGDGIISSGDLFGYCELIDGVVECVAGRRF